MQPEMLAATGDHSAGALRGRSTVAQEHSSPAQGQHTGSGNS